MKSLAVKSLLGFFQLLVGFALGLFASAGTFNYWQGWVCLVVFFTCALMITIYFMKRDPRLIESRLKAGPAAEKEMSQKIIQAFAGLFFILILIAAGLDHRWGGAGLPLSLVLVGNGMIVLGYLAVFWVFQENTYAASVVKVRQKQKVISTGPYALVRHPMYAGAFVMLLGMPLALGSAWAFIPVLLLCSVVVFRLLEEEKFLLKKLPGYKAYFRKVRHRLVPFIW